MEAIDQVCQRWNRSTAEACELSETLRQRIFPKAGRHLCEPGGRVFQGLMVSVRGSQGGRWAQARRNSRW